MQEIEQKFAQADFAAIEERLRQWGASPGVQQEEADHYFNAPDRDFARTDEAFRLRRIGPANFLTYKGPKQTSGVKKRIEIEVPLTDGPEAAGQFTQLLVHLGYRPVAVVRKQRQHYHWRQNDLNLTICLDEVEGLGRFAEVEVLAEAEREKAAEALILSTAAALGLTLVERRSYLEMVLAKRTGGGT
jgi:adenylate cyclase class 2